jgi:protein-S-isoprenylcysteine O-methyltransferase Ste14
MADNCIVDKKDNQRDDLTGEHRLGDAGQIILAFLFMAIWTSDTFIFKYTIFLNFFVPSVVRIPVGFSLLLLSAYLAKNGLSIVFGEERKKPGVIREGLFNIIRHPIYLSEILLYLGCLMLSVSLAAAVIWIITIGFLHYISRYEEKLLFARFREEYVQYMREVPMWIPRFWKCKKEV